MHEQRLFCIGSFIVRAQVLLVHASALKLQYVRRAAIIRLRIVSDVCAAASLKYLESRENKFKNRGYRKE